MGQDSRWYRDKSWTDRKWQNFEFHNHVLNIRQAPQSALVVSLCEASGPLRGHLDSCHLPSRWRLNDVVRTYDSDVVRAWRTTSYVRHMTSCCISYVRCRTCDIQDIDERHRTVTCNIVRYVRCRTSRSTYDIVSVTYDIRHRSFSSQHIVTIVNDVVCPKWTSDIVCTWHTIS